MGSSQNPHGHRPSYVGLVGALRAEFNGLQLEALWIQMREHRYSTNSISTLAQAVHDAHDIAYDSGIAAAGCPQCGPGCGLGGCGSTPQCTNPDCDCCSTDVWAAAQRPGRD